jgi:very-short-patch-repair endonuclease
MARLDVRLMPVFANHHWLATLDDVLAAGGSRRSVDRRLQSGAWERVDTAVFHLTGAPHPWQARVLAPVLAAKGTALASHTTAAALHGIPGFGRGVPEISVARKADRRRAHVIVHTSTDLERCDVEIVDGIPTTDIARTLLDLARRSSDQRLLRSIEWARRANKTDWSTLISTLARHARRGRPGVRRLRRVIVANVHRAEVTDSDFELLVLALLRESGLPDPVLHHRVHDGDRLIAEVDLAYPDIKVAIELDGSVHLQPEVRERDLLKQNELVLNGWTVLRFSYGRFRQHPERVVAEIRAALASARSAA